ncbi:MAG: DUF1223 domain-containing protein [Gammaproteobacteria bacterium]|nr:DUF1223 domain-containing protein [Gammaproteobacteria bacterium]
MKNRYSHVLQPILCFIFLSNMSHLASADEPVSVVELFTSHGCYSCPAADEHLADLINDRIDVIALEYHVDYWDTLVWGSDGSWRDPFSSPEYTQRQRGYHAANLNGRRGVYTPQMVVDGRFAAVGSDRKSIKKALSNKNDSSLNVHVESTSTGVSIGLNGDASDSAKVWLVVFDQEKTTDIPRGENAGKTLDNHHIVKSMQSVGDWKGAATTIQTNITLAEGEGCAVLIQSLSYDTPGPIMGASYCPKTRGLD